MLKEKKIIAIAGATGFVGTSIINKLNSNYKLIGLTRSKEKITKSKLNKKIQWIYCDVYSSESIIKVLNNVDCLIYLIHSMLPSSRLTQASFQDLDLLIADNFANGVQHNNVKQIIYISGLMPKEDESKNTSKHLQSRYEVEKILSNSKASLTTLRCGIIVGPFFS